MRPMLLNGEWQLGAAGAETIASANPATGQRLSARYPIASWIEIEQALEAAQQAVEALVDFPPEGIAEFLETYAANIEIAGEALVEMAHLETALPKEPRLLSVELPRTTNQLRQAANAVRDHSWRTATIDTQTHIRSIYGPLAGPVVIFGPNNFPFAFNSIAGGDFAAAIAAGNPVIAKAHPGHLGTTHLLAEAAFKAVQSANLPPAMVQMVYHLNPSDGLKLVGHPLVGATAFTGSRSAGMKLKAAADQAGKPIYLEMSSLNPVFVLPGALEEDSSKVATELFNSCMLGGGQFCTKPGLTVLLQNETSEAFIESVKTHFQNSGTATLLDESGPKNITAALSVLEQHGAELLVGGQPAAGDGFRFASTLLRVSGQQFLSQPHALQTEAFGPVSLIVMAQDMDQIYDIAATLEGNLTGSIYSHSQGQDDSLYNRLAVILSRKVGRLLNDKMPTGVAVSPAMNHGGPYPSTGHPGFTAVGIPASLRRFAALRCYDNVRPHRLPVELQNPNPTGTMWRFINGTWTQKDI